MFVEILKNTFNLIYLFIKSKLDNQTPELEQPIHIAKHFFNRYIAKKNLSLIHYAKYFFNKIKVKYEFI